MNFNSKQFRPNSKEQFIISWSVGIIVVTPKGIGSCDFQDQIQFAIENILDY